MAEHPNATTAEFSAAYKNLDKATILVSYCYCQFMRADSCDYLRNMKKRVET